LDQVISIFVEIWDKRSSLFCPGISDKKVLCHWHLFITTTFTLHLSWSIIETFFVSFLSLRFDCLCHFPELNTSDIVNCPTFNSFLFYFSRYLAWGDTKIAKSPKNEFVLDSPLKVCLHLRQKQFEYAVRCDFKFQFWWETMKDLFLQDDILVKISIEILET